MYKATLYHTIGGVRRAGCLVLLALLAACEGSPTDLEPIEQLPRALTAAELQTISASNRFAFDLFREVVAAQPDSNVFISPLSASMALGMTMNGARGETLDSMRSTLGFDGLSQHDINAAYRGLIDLLRGLDPRVEMLVGNSIWYRDTFPFHQAFFDTTRSYFDAEVAGLDFNSPSAVTTINRWVDRSTRGRIPDIVDQIDPEVVMYLINAIYFKGDWALQFDARDTRDAPFYAADGVRPVGTTKMMHRPGPILHARGANYEAADLPYGGGAFSMTILLPDRDVTTAEVISGMNPQSWADLAQGFSEQPFDLYLPKFRLEYKKLLNSELKALGMKPAFEPFVADFTGMSPLGRKLYISKVLQKTFVDVNEEGTEAAAATSVEIRFTSSPPSFTVDRPFIFAIREKLTGTLLFIGRIEQPPVAP